jgi:hypothetical protein
MLTILKNDKENFSGETQQQPLKCPKTTNSTNVEGLDDDDLIETIKGKYLPLLKRDNLINSLNFWLLSAFFKF